MNIQKTNERWVMQRPREERVTCAEMWMERMEVVMVLQVEGCKGMRLHWEEDGDAETIKRGVEDGVEERGRWDIELPRESNEMVMGSFI